MARCTGSKPMASPKRKPNAIMQNTKGFDEMSIIRFQKAVRIGSHVLIGIYGESGCGKTYSALMLGRGLIGPGGKLGIIDTETGRGKIYADDVPGGYLYGELTPPFTPERYIEAIDDAEAAGIECLIVDSMSHEWEGLGGILEIADTGTTARGDELKGLAKWAKPKQRHKKFIQKLLTTRLHLILCLRAKEKLEQNGKNIVSAGFVPIQDKRFIYEMTVNMFLPNEGKRGIPTITKCPAHLLGAFPSGQQIGVRTGEAIAQWVSSGVPVDAKLEDLKREGEEAAGQGTETFRAYWKDLEPAKRSLLKPYIPNFESIARSADEENLPPDNIEFNPLGTSARPTVQEIRTDLLPIKKDALNACTTLADVNALDAETKAIFAPYKDLADEWQKLCDNRRSVLAQAPDAPARKREAAMELEF
jgi:hypothetical protein